MEHSSSGPSCAPFKISRRIRYRVLRRSWLYILPLAATRIQNHHVKAICFHVRVSFDETSQLLSRLVGAPSGDCRYDVNNRYLRWRFICLPDKPFRRDSEYESRWLSARLMIHPEVAQILYVINDIYLHTQNSKLPNSKLTWPRNWAKSSSASCQIAN